MFDMNVKSVLTGLTWVPVPGAVASLSPSLSEGLAQDS